MYSSISLEIKIRYVEDMTVGKKLIRKNVFVVISTEDARDQVSTRLCEDGDNNTNPTWNEKLTTTVPFNTKFLMLDVRQRTRSKEKSIAVARVPISDFIGDYTPQNYLHFLSYRMRDLQGEPNGIINFCVNVKGRLDQQYGHHNNYKASEIQGYGVHKQSCVPKPCNGTPSYNKIQ
ncbi:hypothetical protein KSS87_001655 [Heliosperma pusillum]|nr:hypothetical protein KSS87_001655 [Heliosperma pusillum]